MKFQDCKVLVEQKISDALLSLESSASEICLVVESNETLIGTLTDGDIRRALLKGATLDSPLQPYIHTNFTSVHPSANRATVLDLMQARSIRQIPVINEQGHLVGLHLLHELLGCVQRPNWAVIMAGGKGVRLLPITEQIPKPMIPVAGRPILERLILHLVSYGIRRIFIAINHLGHLVENHFGNGEQFGCQIDYLREIQPLGTGGALSLLPELPAHPMLVLNGDLVTEAHLGNMLQFHEQHQYKATIGVREYHHTIPFGCVETEAGQVVKIEEKPLITRLINSGVYIINPELVGRVPKNEFYPITTFFDECLQDGESVGAYAIEEEWLDVGQWEQLQKARGSHSPLS